MPIIYTLQQKYFEERDGFTHELDLLDLLCQKTLKRTLKIEQVLNIVRIKWPTCEDYLCLSHLHLRGL